MTDVAAKRIREQPRFRGIFQKNGKFDEKVALASPTVHGDESKYIEESLRTEFSGENRSALEKEAAGYVGAFNAIALKSGRGAADLAVRLAAEEIYGSANRAYAFDGGWKDGALSGKRVFCSDFMPPKTVGSVLSEGGEPVFIDVSVEDWCMDPEVLEIAFQKHEDVKLVIMNHAYGFPGQIKEIKRICEEHGALLIEDASESVGAKIDGKRVGAFGDYGIFDFGKDRIITGSSGGMLLVNDRFAYQKATGWATNPDVLGFYGQFEGNGDCCVMSDVVAGIVRSQFQHLEEHIATKKAIYRRYQERFDGDFISMNPVRETAEPNYWISCMTCDSSIQFKETRSGKEYIYKDQHGTASPMEIYDALAAFGAQSSPAYRPLSSYPAFQGYDQISLDGSKRSWGSENDGFWIRSNVSKSCFDRGLCLPSDVGMNEEEQERVIDIVFACFSRMDLDRENVWA